MFEFEANQYSWQIYILHPQHVIELITHLGMLDKSTFAHYDKIGFLLKDLLKVMYLHLQHSDIVENKNFLTLSDYI